MQYSFFFFFFFIKDAIQLCSSMVHLEGERERNRATKITQANFHPKRCQPRHKSSLNKQNNNNNNNNNNK